MNDRQKELARHALGLSSRVHQSYRNRFVAGEDHLDYMDWQALVKAGDAETSGRAFGSDMVWFMLTRTGAEKALEAGESLCPEDFPR